MVSHQLQYSNLSSPWYQRRWARRSILMSAIMVGLASLWWAWNSSLGARVRYQYWPNPYEDHVPDSKRPVFSTDPQIVAGMLSNVKESGSAPNDQSYAVYYPPAWVKRPFDFMFDGDFEDGLTFLHRMRRPNGEDRLVSVVITRGGWTMSTFKLNTSTGGAVPTGQKVRGEQLHAKVYTPVGDGTYQLQICDNASVAVLVIPWNEQFTLFEGALDPNDASRLVIGYSLRGQTGTIEGRLGDDDNVMLKVASGPLGIFRIQTFYDVRETARVSNH